MRKPSLLEGSTVWHVATDLKHHFIFPTEIALTTKRPDIVIWSVKAKNVFVIDLTVPWKIWSVKWFQVLLIILFKIIHLFAHSQMLLSITM